MCQTVWFDAVPWPLEVESLGELRAILPGVPLVGDPGPEADGNCLCPIDLPATFTAAGLEYQQDKDFMGYELKRLPGVP